ncbi:MAG: alpha/beta hydrolase [Desulfatitalea sp.]|nr:alpha/beta hydrolase [Desulfatitalea sp.]NNK02016.1 alpha/beta hydrolase [Desulfatitalea sp.]
MNAQNLALVGMKKHLSFAYSRKTVTFLIMCLVTTGCALIQLKKENAKGLSSTVLVGRISTAFPCDGPIIVAAYSMNQGKREVAHYSVLHTYGEYELIVAKGNYYVFAYWDKNSNLIYDANEPAGQYGNPKMVTAPAGGVVGNINIAIPFKTQTIHVPSGFEVSSIKPNTLCSRQAGDITDLDDERFSEELGTKGFWEPFSFFKQFGGNIYFLEEYDPAKTPILFIHGASGTPKGWRYFVNNIDRSRFQPWFFYYPSGSRINGMSYLLLWKLTNLQAKYHFNQIYITAHSMGGLVARSFIINHDDQFPYVKLFIALATPWGGDRMAEYGVKQSPAVIPCWIDLQPEGDFIKSLYTTKLPEHVSFYMFYGHKGSRNPFRSNNDGTITLSSLLDHRPQSEAKMNYAFNEDHGTILFSKDVLAQYNAILNTFDEKQRASLHRSGGYLKILFSYDYPFDGVRPSPTLLLQPVGKKNAETVIELSAYDSGRILGPFPVGDYLATFGAFTAIGRNDVPVTIANTETSELKYILTPDNVIYGCLISAMQSKDWGAGMPYEANFTIQSITLNGAGIHRKLQLLEGDDVNIFFDYTVSRADLYYKGNFVFFGLPPGEYELIIHAKGYKPFLKKCFVKTGMQLDPMLIELTPE